ncbi:phospholipase D/viral envelope [Cooperia oncophora]
MVKLIDEAEDRLDMAVMDYSPCTRYLKPLNSWYGRLDEAVRRAAFDRQVKVRFMVSRWPHTSYATYSYLHSLQDISSQLQCKYQAGKCIRGSIEIRLIQVPDMDYGSIPFARVYHNKYFVTEKAVYVGTSNWTPDYWKYTAGIGMVVRSDDTSQESFMVNQFAKIFERDWTSNYVIPLSYFDNDGRWTNTTNSFL